MFCHQTEQTVHKLEKRKASQVLKDRPVGEQHAESSISRPQPLQRKSFAQPHIDDFALAYCYEHHIAVRRASSGGGNLRTTDEGLLTCMRALGMASYAAMANSSQSAVHAREYYSAALAAVNEALATPKKAARHSTLLLVITMSYFESILGDNTSSIEAWTNHVDGTAILIRLRGREQLQCETGRILFMQASTNMISLCIRLGRRLPVFVHEMWQEAAKYCADQTDPMWQVHSAMLELTDFYSDAINGRFLDGKHVITMALRLDQSLASIFTDPAELWCYKVRKIDGRPGQEPQCPGYVHVYQNLLSSQVWNAMRNGRMLCNAIILATMQKIAQKTSLTAEHHAVMTRSKAVLQTMSSDILATVPQHIGFDSIRQSSPGSTDQDTSQEVRLLSGSKRRLIASSELMVTSLLDYDASEVPVLRTSQGFLLVWCLALVGKVNEAGSLLRKEACRSLRLISRSLGIKQALYMASSLEAGIDIVKY